MATIITATELRDNDRRLDLGVHKPVGVVWFPDTPTEWVECWDHAVTGAEQAGSHEVGRVVVSGEVDCDMCASLEGHDQGV